MTKPGKKKATAINGDKLIDSIISILEKLGREEVGKINEEKNLLDIINRLVKELSNEYDIEKNEAIKLITKNLATKYNISKKSVTGLVASETLIPLEIFSYKLSGLEALVKYLKENLGLSFKEIASKLNRKQTTIWTSYTNAVKKQKKKFVISSDLNLSLEKVSDRTFTVTEAVVHNLKARGMRYNEISSLLNRDQRNIWSTNARAKKKLSLTKKKTSLTKKGKLNSKEEKQNGK